MNQIQGRTKNIPSNTLINSKPRHMSSFVDPRDGIWRNIRTHYNRYKPPNADPITVAETNATLYGMQTFKKQMNTPQRPPIPIGTMPK